MHRRHTLGGGGPSVSFTDEELVSLVTRAPIVETDLTIQQRVLAAVCESTGPHSTVTLAADLWRGPGHAMSADIVAWAVDDLNHDGLVVYTEGSGHMYGVYLNIRPTEAGFKAAGYPPPTHIVGNPRGARRADQAIHPGDKTDFRVHMQGAVGSPIVVEDITTHMRRFPDHKHDLEGNVSRSWRRRLTKLTEETKDKMGWRPVFVSPDDDIQPTLVASVAAQMQVDAIRNTIKQAMKEEPMASNAQLPSVEQIARERGISTRQAYKIRNDMSAAQWGNIDIPQNQKAMALEALNKLNRPALLNEVRQTMQELGFTIDAHSLTHVIWSLQKQGMVRFREAKNSSRSTESVLSSIRILPAGVRQLQAYRSKNGAARVSEPIHEARPSRRDKPIIADKNVPKKLVERAIEDEQAAPKIDTSELPKVVADRVPDQLKAHPSPVTETKAEVTPPPVEVAPKVAEVVEQVVAKPVQEDFKTRFPMVWELIDRRRKVEAAAELLMAAGQEEMAISALEKINYTPFEVEVLRLATTLIEKEL